MLATTKKRSTTVLPALAAVLCLVATSCSLCERVDTTKEAGATARGFAELTPADARIAVFVGDLKKIRDASQQLQASMGKSVPIEGALAEFKQKFGLDLTDIESIKAKGIRAEEGLAFVAVGDDAILMLPVENKKLFENFVLQLGKERYSAAEQMSTMKVGNEDVSVLYKAGADGKSAPAQPTDTDVVVAWAWRDSTAVIYPGLELSGNSGKATDALGKVLAVKSETSMAKDPGFEKITATVGSSFPMLVVFDLPGQLEAQAKELDEYTYGKEDAARLRKMKSKFGRIGVGFNVDKDRGMVRVKLLLDPGTTKRATAAATAAGPPDKALKTVSGSPAIALRLAMDPIKALDEILALMDDDTSKDIDAFMRVGKATIGVDIRGKVLPALNGNIVLALYKADPLAIMALTNGRLDTFLRQAEGTVTLGLKDEKAVVASLDSAAKSVPGAVVRGQDTQGLSIWHIGDSRFAFETSVETPPGDPTPKPADDTANDDGAGDDAANDNANDKPTDDKPTDDQPTPKPPTPAGERPENTMFTVAVGNGTAVIITPKMSLSAALDNAAGKGAAHSGVLVDGDVKKTLATKDHSMVVVDVPAVIESLGPQGALFARQLKPFRNWFLRARPDADGAVVDLDLTFAPNETDKPKDKDKAQ